MRKESEKNQGSAKSLACIVHISFNVDIPIACSKLPERPNACSTQKIMHINLYAKGSRGEDAILPLSML